MSLIVMIVVAMLGLVESVQARILSIYQIQYTSNVNGISPEHGNIINCLGGIVTQKPGGGRPRLVIQDSNYPEGWGAVQVKDFLGGSFDNVAVGDWVSFTNVEVEEFKGTTFLQYKSDNDPNFYIESRNNCLPKPLVVNADEIAAPIQGINEWVVANYNAEKYEGMLIKVRNVYVKDTGYGKAFDNYILGSNIDSNSACWASDYMNDDIAGIYHHYVDIGQNFCSVTGILEQYTCEKDGIYYDYYQLLTTKTEDFLIWQTADLDNDCDVDFADFSAFTKHWLGDRCTEPDWCGGSDLTNEHSNGIVDTFDLIKFAEHWLEGS